MSDVQIGFEFEHTSYPLHTLCDELITLHFILPIDKHIVMALAEKETSQATLWAVVCLNLAVRNGHICLTLTELASLPLIIPASCFELIQRYISQNEAIDDKWPTAAKWREILKCSALVAQHFAPVLILENDRLYFSRYRHDEDFIAQKLNELASKQQSVEVVALLPVFQQLYPEVDEKSYWQIIAVLTALKHQLLVLTGGPGTGKTTTVLNVLVLLLSRATLEGRVLNIKMVAPTGKAAARMTESVNSGMARLPESLRDGLIETIAPAQTLHRFLGYFPGTDTFIHDAAHPVAADVLVVDEASMIDQYLLSKLLRALPSTCKVILLGDKDQLASVEAGAVLGEICATAMNQFSQAHQVYLKQWLGDDFVNQTSALSHSILPHSALSDVSVQLQYSHRFKGGIKRLAEAVNLQSVRQLDDFMGHTSSDVSFHELTQMSRYQLKALLVSVYQPYFDYLHSNPVFSLQLFEKLNDIQILCAVREGYEGVESINETLSEYFNPKQSRYFHGQPVMVTQNDYTNGLFNGDIGIVLWVDGQWKVGFNQDGVVRSLNLNRLQAFESVFAMTIHKSQGSEFTHVVLIVPQNQSSVLNKEVLYTGITRAKEKLTVCANYSVLAQAIHKRVVRMSGLAQRLHKIN